MASERITIGALARRSGVPVKKLRFYSDEGLLPPVGRTGSGYRVYDEEAAARLDLIRTLREAGLPVAAIKAIFARDLSLAEALRLRAVEAHIASLQHVAAALRAVLRSEPIEANIGRLCTVTRLTTEERKAVIERFVERVSAGVAEGEAWKREVMREHAPRLPETPTPAQLDAWIELAELVQDEAFVADMRASAARSFTARVDLAAYRRARDEADAAARAAISAGVPPTAGAAREVVARLVAGLAAAMGRLDDAALRAELRDTTMQHDPRLTRYWELVAVLRDQTPPPGPDAAWRWLAAAFMHHLAPA